jgi:hypothetical protein
MPETIRYDGLYEYAQQHGLDYNELCRVVCASLPSASLGEQREPEPQLVGYDECRCILTQYCDGTCRPVFAMPAVLERARTLYANSPRAYRGTNPLPWNRAPMPTRQEFIEKAKAEAASPASKGAGGGVCIDCNTPLQRFCSECKADPLGTSPEGGA